MREVSGQPALPKPPEVAKTDAEGSPRGFKARGIGPETLYSMMPHMSNAVKKARERQRAAKQNRKPINAKSTVFPLGRIPTVYRHLGVKPPRKVGKANTGNTHLQHIVSDLSGDRDLKAKLRRELFNPRREGGKRAAGGAQTARPAARRPAATEEADENDEEKEKQKVRGTLPTLQCASPRPVRGLGLISSGGSLVDLAPTTRNQSDTGSKPGTTKLRAHSS